MERIITPESNELALEARYEIETTGSTKIVCPLCGTTPKVTMTPRGERTITSCKCGHVYDCDINL